MSARIRHELLDGGLVRVSLIPAHGAALSAVLPEGEIKRACWSMLADVDPDEDDSPSGPLRRTAPRGSVRVALMSALAQGPADAPTLARRMGDPDVQRVRVLLAQLKRGGKVTSTQSDGQRALRVWSAPGTQSTLKLAESAA